MEPQTIEQIPKEKSVYNKEQCKENKETMSKYRRERQEDNT